MADLIQIAGWVLIHFVWEGAILGAVSWLGCLCLRRSSPNARYLYLCVMLFLCALSPVMTWLWIAHLSSSWLGLAGESAIGYDATNLGIRDVPGSDFQAHYSPSAGPALNYVRISEALREWIPFITHVWAIGVCFLILKFAWEYFLLRRLTRTDYVSAGAIYNEMLTSLAERIGVRKTVTLIESSLVEIPTVMGWFKPILIVPAAFFTSLPADQIEAIFAHELAHVRRYDYCVNLLQVVIETTLFYHPVVWWIGNLIREERENCCDDMAIAVLGNKITYVSALATLERARILPTNVALAADGGSLLKRVQRVFDPESNSFSIAILVRESYKGLVLGILMMSVVFAACFATTRGAITRHTDDVYLAKALVLAAEKGDLATMDSLLRQGANPDANVRPTGYDAVYCATIQNQAGAIKLLLQYGADIDGRNTSGLRPIDWALTSGNLPTATLLRDEGASISPAAWAAATGDLVKLKSLANEGALIKGQTSGAMKAAVSMGQMNIVRFLEYFEGKAISGRFLVEAASSGNLGMMSYILDQDAASKMDIEAAMDQAVVFYDQPEAARLLLAHGADPNRYTRWDQYILSMAKSARMTQVLLEGGANPNIEDGFGGPLSKASDAKAIKVLVQHGAQINRISDGKLSVIENAIVRDWHDQPDRIEELRKSGAMFDAKTNGVGALAIAVQRNDLKTMQYLLKLGVDPNDYSNEGQVMGSPLAFATSVSSLDAAQFLLQSGGSPSGNPQDSFTPLSEALLSKNWDMANLLQKAGARDVCDLSVAAAFGDVDEVACLIARGANVNEPDRYGHTPLYYAKKAGRSAVIRVLLQYGAVGADSV